jgi:maltose/moltooligosaccharide transporter
VIPQLVAASLLGFLLNTFLGGEPEQALAIGGISLIVAGLCVLRVKEPGSLPATATSPAAL